MIIVVTRRPKSDAERALSTSKMAAVLKPRVRSASAIACPAAPSKHTTPVANTPRITSAIVISESSEWLSLPEVPVFTLMIPGVEVVSGEGVGDNDDQREGFKKAIWNDDSRNGCQSLSERVAAHEVFARWERLQKLLTQ